MKKSKFIKSTIILVIGGFLTKILGMFIKIVMTRLMGTEGIGIYMILSPTFMIMITLAQLGLPIAISKLVSEDKRNNKNLVASALPITIIINIVIILFLFICGKFLANNLLHEPRIYLGIISIGFVLPFISISSIIRGYFFGKQKMFPHVVSNITEDIVRLIILALGIPIFIKMGIEVAIMFIILSNIASELTSIFVLFFFLPKKFKIRKEDIKPNKDNLREILSISLPTTGSRIIGNIGYFLEPIILTATLLFVGYDNNFIVNEYGIINGYVMPLVLLPSFFTMAISQALIPPLSYSYAHKNYDYAKKKIKQAICFSLMIGIPATIVLLMFPEFFLKTIYNTTSGVNYIKILAPVCLFHYIQAPISSSLQAMGKAKQAMYGTMFAMIIRTLSLFIFSSLHIGMYGLIIATSLNILFVTIYDANNVRKAFK
ncbi:MAG: polysaccharide biosynthesis protein [Clostridium sp.]|nr:polysaccharide biosynthesis protein [Clostridium sp.]MCM1444028.1 polysaccharide biosynthesis protein [Candidatus Amulumruptor caecigallinarius]